MQLRRFQTVSLVCIALVALCMHWLLPFAHAAQMQSSQSGLDGLVLCSVAAGKQATSAPTQTADTGMLPCPICVSSAIQHLAPPVAPSVLPSAREHASSFRLVRNEGFFIPTASYTHPQSHAPPIE
ncbi:DUF2946 family protein [Chitinibacter fontanus]|uniref:DUF2946 family protein n=1 Tax=Chitinibacter fontanus TaxID=1737446 RepID=A0A7D5Z7X3_9NEIS|nr:DUF2946 family protein [Chitinibacter fontanus]QLI82323.1 DUF2946 family protein [Chitinibacter fontanus]